MQVSVVVAHRLNGCGSQALEYRLSSCGTRASLLHSTWDLPRPGLKPRSPAMAGKFLTTAPPGKSLTADLSAETLQARREWQDIFKVMKGKHLQPRLLYPARSSFRFDGEIKTFTEKQKLREFSTTKPALQQMLKELL